MRKLLVLSLALVLVFSMSGIGMAFTEYEYGKDGDQGATADVLVKVLPFMDVWYDSPEHYDGLFGTLRDGEGDITGEPGIYISDGPPTKNSALALWSGAGADSSMVISGYNTGETDKFVEMFKVAANTHVKVTMDVDWSSWMNTPTFFRVSSDREAIYGQGVWDDELARVANYVTFKTETPDEYKDIINAHNTFAAGGSAELRDWFDIDFPEYYLCEGPLEFHVNAALWLLKIGQVEAKDYTAQVTVTVEAYQPPEV